MDNVLDKIYQKMVDESEIIEKDGDTYAVVKIQTLVAMDALRQLIRRFTEVKQADSSQP